MTESTSASKPATPSSGDAPSPWVLKHAPAIAAGARVLDLACGRGRHARWLAAGGWQVVAADRDAEALAGLRGIAGIETVCRDFEAETWPFAPQSFAAVVVTRYLHRPLLPQLVAALAPGGLLIYETFMVGNEAYGRPTNPDFLLRAGELREFVRASGELLLIDFREGLVAEPAPAMIQSLCARR